MDPQRDVDRGWAWVVLVATVVNMMLQSFLSVSAGIFQVGAEVSVKLLFLSLSPALPTLLSKILPYHYN